MPPVTDAERRHALDRLHPIDRYEMYRCAERAAGSAGWDALTPDGRVAAAYDLAVASRLITL